MAAPTPLTDDQLKALAMQELRSAVGYYGGKLADQRRKAEIYYLGEAKDDLAPPEIDGRSSVVSTDVRNTIESMLPQLMAKFVGGDQVVEFEPTTKDDEQKVSQCTDYLNYLFLKKNNGHKVCYSWFKDALLQKNGIVKCWWDTRVEEKREEYRGLTVIELGEILDDPEVEPIEQTSYPDEEDAEQRKQAVQQLQGQLQQAMQAAQHGNQQAAQAVQQMQQQLAHIEAQPPAMLYDVSFKRSLKGGKLAIENVPPEEFLISREAKSIATARMSGHRVPRTLSELRSMGYKNVDNIGSDDAAASLNAERVERLGYDDEFASLGVQNPGDDSQTVVWLNELYIRCDYDGDGIAELRKVVIAGNELLDNEEVDVSPFISITPVPMPHKFFGLSIADLAMEAQKTKTQMLRSQLDNLYLEVNGRYFAVDGQVNLDDLLTSRPGSVVRMKQPGMAGRLDQGKGNIGEVSNLMEYMEMDLEQRTGWTRYSQGNDSKALNQTATGVQIITNKGDMRVDLIARNFGEGFRELFDMMLKLTAQHQDKAVQIRVAGQWVDMDPREWRNKFDVTINIGLGIGSKDEQVQKLMALSQQQAHVMAIGVANPKNVYNMMSDIAKGMGQKNPDKYFNDPELNPPPPSPPPPEAMKAQAQMQLEQFKAQASAQSQQAQLAAEYQSKQAEIQANAQLEAVKANYQVQADEAQRAHEAQLEQLRMSMQAQVDRARDESQAAQETLKMQQEAQLAALEAEYKDQQHTREQAMTWQIAQLEAATKVEVANIAAAVKVNDTATQAATAKETADLDGKAEKKLPMKEKPAPAPAPAVDHTAALTAAVQKFADAADKMSQPKKTVVHRDANGKITHSTQE